MDESDVGDLIEQAFAALRNEDYVRALAVGDQLVSARPDRAVARAIRAQALLGADSPDESFNEARRAVELSSHDEHAHRLLAMAAWRTGRLALAQESFERAVEHSDRRPMLLGEYAWFMANERGPKLAERSAREAVEADAECSTAWAALGLAQFRLHRRTEAETSLRRALVLNPNDIYAQSAMMALLQDCRNDRQAEALASLLQEHAGTEELVAAVRDDAKQRQIARMLMERNVDITRPSPEPRRYGWIWMLATSAVVAMLSYFVDPWAPVIVVLLSLFLLVSLRHWFD
jgi:Tfp pilus assembly protein PilF